MMKIILNVMVSSLILTTSIASLPSYAAAAPLLSQFSYQENQLPISALEPLSDNLPEIGTASGDTLSIAKEIQMGDYYARKMRASAPLIQDPLLEGYIDRLGKKLVAHANSVKTPFKFFIVNNPELNAFAFFGGNIVLHSGLFQETDNEDQLASVIAHEISHVTQRHLARAMADEQKNAPLTWMGAFGSILLATASPQAGMAALTSSLAGSQQGIISFTQANEQEADRLGINTLARSGFDPQAMPAFLSKLASKSGSSTQPPEMLLTHPLPESRLADSRNRANQMPPHTSSSSLDFMLAKARVLTLYSNDQTHANEYLKMLAGGNAKERVAANYGYAIQRYQAKDYEAAQGIIQQLLTNAPQNPWFLDIATDTDIAQQKAAQAVIRLEKNQAATSDNPALILNLANAEIESGQYVKATRLLNNYTWHYASDLNGWDLLAKASALQNYRGQELAARAETKALKGDFNPAIELLGQAVSQTTSIPERARDEARIDQFKNMQKTFSLY